MSIGNHTGTGLDSQTGTGLESHTDIDTDTGLMATGTGLESHTFTSFLIFPA